MKNNKNKKNKNEDDIRFNKKITELRKKQLIEEVDIILAKLTEEDIKYFEENDVFSEIEIKFMKKRRKLRSNKRAIFYSRIRCDEETLNRIIQTTKQINNKNKKEKLNEKIHERERYLRSERIKGRDDELRR